jgi:hypothetical protein
MSQTFVKLFSSILASTIWTEPAGTKLTWITMLAMSNAKGEVYGSIPGIAHLAGVSIKEAETAINKFMSPDKYSRDPNHEGRRIKKIDGGWQLLNYIKFREIINQEQIRENKRKYMENYRKRVQRNTVNINADAVNLVTKDVTPRSE